MNRHDIEAALIPARATVAALEALLGPVDHAPEPLQRQATLARAPLESEAGAAPTERERFERCVREVLKHEGGWSDHPSDPGGATNLGVTLATLTEWRGKPVTKADVKALTVDEASAIYRAKYWTVAGCDRLPAGLDMIVFDMAVNSGPARAVRTLQGVLGVAPDGIVGPKTLAAARAADVRQTVQTYAEKREAFYRSLRTFPTFGKGWLRRLSAVTEKARAWA
jgi:lysozyme family protein